MFFLRSRQQWQAFLALGLLLTISKSLWPSEAASTLQPAASALPQDGHIQAFFNQSEASIYTDPYRQIERYGDNLEQVVITAIDSAEASIEIAVQELNLPLVAEALASSAQRGVQVRLILDNQYANPTTSEAKAEAQAKGIPDILEALRSAGVPFIDDTADGSKGSGLMHHKFLVIDGQQVLTGSANLTMSGIHGDRDLPNSRGNANALLKIDSLQLASRFTEEFEQMWGDGPGAKSDSRFGLSKRKGKPSSGQGPHKDPFQAEPAARQMSIESSPVTLQFSPSSPTQPQADSTNGLIQHALSQASQSIDLALFVFTDQPIANQLQVQAQQGSQLRVLIDPSFIYRSYSEALDLLGVVLPDGRCKVEADNRPWRSPISTVGSPQLPPGDKLHHKFAVIDNRTVIIGSHNWSKAANAQNDEALLVIENKTVAAHFSREFDRLYRQPDLGNTEKLQYLTQKSQQQCHF